MHFAPRLAFHLAKSLSRPWILSQSILGRLFSRKAPPGKRPDRHSYKWDPESEAKVKTIIKLFW